MNNVIVSPHYLSTEIGSTIFNKGGNAVDAALAAAVAGFDVIQAEKFSPVEIAALVKRIASMAYTRARPIIAAAGGVNAANAAAYAEAGADVLVTSSPYQAKPKDVQMRISAADAPMLRFRHSNDSKSGSPMATAAHMVDGC